MKALIFFILVLMSSDTFASLTKNQKLMGALDHFYITPTLEKTSKKNKVTDCRRNISKVICLVNPKRRFAANKRPCLKGSQSYAHYFEALYDNYPAVFQKMFCSLRKIYIEKNLRGTAYAGTTTDVEGNVNGAYIGIKKSVIDKGISLSRMASWKEQLSFGGSKTGYTLTEGLPIIDTLLRPKVNDFLYFVVAHEFGHLFDFSNDLNRTENCDGLLECPVSADSWAGFSWVTNRLPKDKYDFENRLDFCFYDCKGQYLGKDKIPKIYEDFYQTNFVTTYASRQPWDDFAESLAFFVMNRYLEGHYDVVLNDGTRYDLMGKLNLVEFKAKYKYLDYFLARNNIKYP